jgi:serine/threonine-protein kinase
MIHPSRQQLWQFLAEELPPADRAGVEEHLNGCEPCLERLELLQRPRPTEVHILADLLLNPPPEVAPPRNGDGRLAAAHSTADAAPASASPWPSFAGYEILARVGGGGMGEVYQARQCRTGRVVALKTVAPASAAGSPEYAERLARFRAEVEAVSRLQHPNVVSVYDVGEHNGRPYFTMEWVSGGSLAARLAGQPAAERQAARWVAVLARALHQVHQCGVVHRDLKPANILLGDADTSTSVPTLKIADFGVAKLLGRVDTPTQPWQLVGTPEYMAPEQAAGGALAVGPAADVYALGVLLYEQLTGRPPFKAHEPLETLRQVRDDEPLSPRRLRPGLSRDLETICLKCLHKNPAGRYPSALALADDLDRWLLGRPITARPCRAAARAAKWARRHPERAALVGLAAAVVLVLVAGFFWRLWAGGADYARQLAGAADHQLLLVKYAVGQAAREERLRRLLGPALPDSSSLRDFLVHIKQDFMRWFTRPGEEPPIINWFVMDPAGTILADSYEDPRSVGKNYAFRDYFRALAGTGAAEPAAVHVSRVYHSEQDDRYKFTITTRVWDGDRMLGLLGASVATGSKMVALDMGRELPGACVVGPMDRTPRPGTSAPDGGQPEYVVVLHRAYVAPSPTPLTVAPARLAVLESFAANPGQDQAAERFSAAGGMVHYARVGDSPFAVIVEQPYPWPLHLLLRRPLGWAAVATTGFALLWWLRRARPRRAPG